MTDLRWHPAAAREAKAARRWYQIDQDAPEAARRFQAALQRALSQIVKAPERWPVLADDLHKRPLRGFPYRVVYQQRSDHVLIVAVMHERQQPQYWRERVG
jgi:plasmid stabilization system protein ParE